MSTGKPHGSATVLDACCGSKMFWFDREDRRAVFMDHRSESYSWEVRKTGRRRHLVVLPSVIGDFSAMPFEDCSFHLVVFDPPHRSDLTVGGWQEKTYGKLVGNWQEMLRAGFKECFRVLRPGGVLVFKWNAHHIPVAKILALTPEKPLFGQKCGKTAKTHWLVFMKETEHP